MNPVSGRPHVGLVGCGRWGRHILRDLVSLDCDVTVVARSDESIDRARAGGAAAIVAHDSELPSLDGVVVAASSERHAELVERLIPLKVPIFVEKPLTVEAVSAERIAAAAPDRVFVMHKWRYHPGVDALAGIVRSGELGEARAIETVRIGFGRPHDEADGVWHLVPHDLSIILHVLGTLPPAYAARADRVASLGAGIVGLLGDSPWASVEVHTRSTQRIRRVTLRCSDGIATLDGAADDRVAVLRGYPTGDRPPEPQQRPVATELPLLAELRAFVGHLHGGPPPMSSAAEGAEICRRIAELRALAGIEA